MQNNCKEVMHLKEILINYKDIEKVLSNIKSSIISFKTDLPKSIADHNKLNLVTEIEEINKQLELVLKNYQALLMKNEEMTSNSIKMMKASDESLANSMINNS
ncbi:YwqI/YxiC family protein [Bacillus sp. AP8]|uniref:YwqI/YxiC family protein n=1 Tax=Bacillus sp. AP8 TaxID=1513284 RepID=UPI00037A4CA1|nr:YwqI/YxiC family protein [Bacillus sp. AP8]